MSIHSIGLSDDEPLTPGGTGPLAVPPKTACVMLGVGQTRLYELIEAGELESYKEGKARRITTRSIYARVKRLVEQEKAA
jgi:excisionase family DNA binding protein